MQNKFGIILVLLIFFSSCRKDEVLAPKVDTLKSYEFMFMTPTAGRTTPIYDLSNGDFLSYFQSANGTIEFKILDNQNFNIQSQRSHTRSSLFPNYVWGITVASSLQPIANDHFLLAAIAESNLDPVNGPNFEYPCLYLHQFDKYGNITGKDTFILSPAYIGYYSKPNVEFYNNEYYVGYTSYKNFSPFNADSIHIMKFDANFNLIAKYGRVSNNAPLDYESEMVVNSEGIYFYYFDDLNYFPRIAFFENNGSVIQQIFDKPAYYINDPWYSFGTSTIINWNDQVTIMGQSISPNIKYRSGFKTTDRDVSTLKYNHAQFLHDSTYRHYYTGYSFNAQNDLIMHYEEFGNKSLIGFSIFDLAGSKIKEIHFDLPSLSAYPVHIRDNADGTYTILGNKKVEGADVWQAFMVKVDEQGNIIRN